METSKLKVGDWYRLSYGKWNTVAQVQEYDGKLGIVYKSEDTPNVHPHYWLTEKITEKEAMLWKLKN